MVWLAYFLIGPLSATIIAKIWFKKTFDWREFGITVGVSLALTCGLYYGSLIWDSGDTEIISGYVTDKKAEHVSCEHSYQCNPRQVTSCSGSGKSRSCSTRTVWSTCYEHSYDVDWDVKTTVGTITIDRVDRRGLSEPARWSKVKVGEPAAATNFYQNYVKASKDSLFHIDPTLMKKYDKKLPQYPKIFDYYQVNRVFNFDQVWGTQNWNEIISGWLKDAGKRKQVNFIAVVTRNPQDFADALYYAWEGGKKNDVIAVYGVDEERKVRWAQVNSFASGVGNQELLIRMRLESLGKEISDDFLKEQLSFVDKDFKRYEMSNFDYLKEQAQPSEWAIIVIIIIVSFGATLTMIYFSRD